MSTLYKKYSNFKGINRSSNALTGTDVFSYEQENLDNKENGVVKSRKGFSYIAQATTLADILGTGEFIDTENNKTHLVYFLENGIVLYKKGTLTLNFSGTHTYAVRANDANDSMSLFIDSTEFDLGVPNTGTDTIADIIIDVAAGIGDYSSSSVDGDSSAIAYSLQITEVSTATNTVDLEFYYTETVTTSGILSLTHDARNDDDFERIPSTNLDGCLYISSPYDGLIKYDGLNLYKAGFPEKKYPMYGVADATTNANYYCELFRTDARGNIIRSGLYPLSGFIDANTDVYTYLKSEVLEDEWGIQEVLVRGKTAAATDVITRQSGATLQVGDYISLPEHPTYSPTSPLGLHESGFNNLQIRKITAVSGNDYTLDDYVYCNTAVDTRVYSNAPRASIYRSADGGGDLYYYCGDAAFSQIDTDDNTIRFAKLHNSTSGSPAIIDIDVTNNSTVNGAKYSINGQVFTITAAGSATLTAVNIQNQINTFFGSNEITAVASGATVTITRATNGDFGDTISLVSGSGIAFTSSVFNVLHFQTGRDYYFKRGVPALTDRSTLLIPNKTYIEPPKCKYVTVFRNQLVLANDNDDDKNTAYYTDVLDKESFSLADSFRAGNSDRITGIKGFFNGLYISKDTNWHLVQGDLDVGKFQVDDISKFVGCVSHQSIIDGDGRLYFLSRDGFRFIDAASNNIIELYRPVKDLVLEDLKRTDVTNNTTAIDRFNETILFTVRTSSTTSDIYVYNYVLKTWTLYKDLPCDVGIYNVGSEVLAVGTEPASSVNIVSKFNTIDNSKYAYMDGKSAVDFKYTSHFEDLEYASVFKKWLRFKLFSNNTSDRTAFDATIEFFKEFDFSTAYASTAFSFLSTIFSKRTKMGNKKVKSNAVKISGSIDNQIFEMTGFEYEINLPYKTKVKE